MGCKASAAASKPLEWQPAALVAHSASSLSEAIEKPAEHRELPGVPPVLPEDRSFNGSSVHLISTGVSALVPDSGLPLSVLEFGVTDSVHTGA